MPLTIRLLRWCVFNYLSGFKFDFLWSLIDTIGGFDFNPKGESIALISWDGTCIISDVNTQIITFSCKLKVDHGNLNSLDLFHWVKQPNKSSWGLIWYSVFLSNTSFYLDVSPRCRWSTSVEEPFLYVKPGTRLLNVLDAEKKEFILKKPMKLKAKSNDNYSWSKYGFTST